MNGVPYNINMDESTRVNLRKMTQHMLYNQKEMLRLLQYIYKKSKNPFLIIKKASPNFRKSSRICD